VTWHYLKTLFWLRARLFRNQLRKAGTIGQLIQALVVGLMALGGVGAFLAGLTLGIQAFDSASSLVVMLVWDGIVVAFVFFWLVGLLAELQRSELLSVERFLGLPIPARSVFIVNYLGSLVTLSTVIFAPGMVGLALGLSRSKGPQMLWLLPLVLGFFVLVTAVTYQFQGWLARLMSDKRRRRNVVALLGLAVMVMALAPSQMSMMAQRVARSRGETSPVEQLQSERRALRRAHSAGEVGDDEFAVRSREIQGRIGQARAARTAALLEGIERVAAPANRFIPLGWLPHGARALTEGRVAPALFGFVGLVAVGMLSLARSYRTTMRLYLGEAGASMPRSGATPARPRRQRSASTEARLVERRLPWLSEQVAAITLASLQSLLRAPEARLMMLTALLMGAFFGGVMLRPQTVPSPFLRPLLSTAGFTMVLVALSQLTTNLFGFDRDGFRVYVLGPASRRDILLGKNLALLPMALAIGLPVLVLMQVLTPLRVDHFLATLVQMTSLYLVFCLVGNTVSVLAPTPVRPGSLQPVRPRGLTVLFHLGAFFALPLVLGPLLLPLGIEAALAWLGYDAFPVYLVLASLEVIVVVFLYRWILGLQGRLLQAREQQILEVVTGVRD